MAYGFIYKITNLKNGKVYIGQTKQGFDLRYQAIGDGIERVYNYYKRRKDKGLRYNVHLLNALEKYGTGSFSVEKEFDSADSARELDALEIKYIAEYKADVEGYNSESGGRRGRPNAQMRKRLSVAQTGEKNGFYNKHHTEETRRYLSKIKRGTLKGDKNPNFGNRWTEEQKRALSEKKKGVPSPNKGRKMSPEVCRINSLAHKGLQAGEKHPRYGKHWDEEHKKHQSEVMKGRFSGVKNPNRKRVLCLNTGEVFETINDAAAKYGISPTGISSCLHTKRKSAGKDQNGIGLQWEIYREV